MAAAKITDYLAQRPKGWLQAEQRHAKRIAQLRIVLPVLALLLLTAVFIWPVAAGRRLIAMPPAPATPQLSMDNPRFTGTDEQNRPFTLSATRATQQPQDLMQLDLVAPQAQMTGTDGQPVNGTASVGRFDQSKKRLWLGGTVQLEQKNPQSGDILHFNTTELFADLSAHTVWGNQPARLTGGFGTIEGQGFQVFDGGKVLLFTGPSRAILNGKSSLDLPAPLVDKPKE